MTGLGPVERVEPVPKLSGRGMEGPVTDWGLAAGDKDGLDGIRGVVTGISHAWAPTLMAADSLRLR